MKETKGKMSLWLNGIDLLQRFYLGYLTNKEMLKGYREDARFYITSLITAIFVIFSTSFASFGYIHAHGLDFSSLFYVSTTLGMCFCIYFCLSIWKKGITFKTKKLYQNKFYKIMTEIDSIPIFGKEQYYDVFLINLFFTTLICILYPEKLDNRKSSNSHEKDMVTSLYNIRRPSITRMISVFENPKLPLTVSTHNSWYDFTSKYHQNIMNFFKELNETDDIESICDQKTLTREDMMVLNSPFCYQAMKDIHYNMLPEFEERLRAKVEEYGNNSVFRNLLSAYESSIKNTSTIVDDYDEEEFNEIKNEVENGRK